MIQTRSTFCRTRPVSFASLAFPAVTKIYAALSLANPRNLCLALTLSLGICVGCSGEKPEAPKPDPAPSFQTAPVQFRKLSADLALPASIQADPASVVHVFAPVSGRLIALKVKAGDEVRAGQAVAVVQSSDAASARSDYEKARAQAERSAAALRRASLLYDHEVIAAKDLEDAKAQAASDKSDLARAQERLELLGLNDSTASDKVTVHAPRGGVVLETTSATGEFSKSLDASNPLLTIADLNSVWVVGNSYEKDLRFITRGAPVTITTDAYPNQDWRGRTSYISDVVDANTHTVKVRVVLANPNRKLKPDMFATIHIGQPESQVAVIPSGALLRQDNDEFVILQQDKKTFVKRSVEVAKISPQEVLVRSGLQPGDQIVTSGAELLREAAK